MSERVPPRFRGVSFDSYRADTLSQRSAVAAVRGWMTSLERGPLLALVGSQGVGKSHLFYAAASELIRSIDAMSQRERAFSRTEYPLIAPWYALSDDLRYGKAIQTEAGSRQQSAAEVRAALWSRKVVMLDEVRKTSGSEFDDTELAKFACHAYDNRIAVLITTNWNPLSDVMGPAAASRFTQVIIDGPDARQAA